MKSYSQHGEDLFIQSSLPPDCPPYAVDVGANDGQSWSNTYLFGISGFNLLLIEPMPEYARRCRALYEGVGNVWIEEIAISDTAGDVDFYINDDFDADQLSMRSSMDRDMVPSSLVSTVAVKSMPLGSVLEKHEWPRLYAFLSVDAEGRDFEVLKTARLQDYLPLMICVEEGESHSQIQDYLSVIGYTRVKTLGPNGIYKHIRCDLFAKAAK